MNCKNPYIMAPSGADEKGFKNSNQVRRAVTPFGCGQCLPCRINKAREWTNRMMLEQTSHDFSSFITLTYEDEKIPKYNGYPELRKKDLVDFLKRLRYHSKNRLIRYFGVGEYGSETERPHFHLALFGVDFWEKTLISKAWDKGFVYLGDLNKNSARYMTEYVVKNMRKHESEGLNGREPEFAI